MSHRFSFSKLDAKTRAFMLEEIAQAQQSNQLYYSTRFTDTGKSLWPKWLHEAAEKYDEHWLSFTIEVADAMKGLETKAKQNGGYTAAHVPHTAAETLADGQFNRFYIAAICRRAIQDGQATVRVYRAKQSDSPRLESNALVGKTINPTALLNEVRNRETSLKCELLKPNSGLSIDC